jgi:hypothetical protein
MLSRVENSRLFTRVFFALNVCWTGTNLLVLVLRFLCYHLACALLCALAFTSMHALQASKLFLIRLPHSSRMQRAPNNNLDCFIKQSNIFIQGKKYRLFFTHILLFSSFAQPQSKCRSCFNRKSTFPKFVTSFVSVLTL